MADQEHNDCKALSRFRHGGKVDSRKSTFHRQEGNRRRPQRGTGELGNMIDLLPTILPIRTSEIPIQSEPGRM
jgi:hypothetical protein